MLRLSRLQYKQLLRLFLGLQPVRTVQTVALWNGLGMEETVCKSNCSCCSGTHFHSIGIEDVKRLCKQGRLKEALNVLGSSSVPMPDASTYSSLLQACVKNKSLAEAKLVHAHIIATGFEPDLFLGASVVIVYAKCGNLVDACCALRELAQQNVVSWNAIIAAYSTHGNPEEGLSLFNQMKQGGIQPDHFTYATVVSAASLQHGRKIHDCIIKSGFQSDVVVGGALIDMYVKSGTIDDARKVFDEMPIHNVVSWTAMIAAYARHGSGDEALNLFYQMQRTRVQPNHFTFASVLSACTSLANLEHGKRIHNHIIKNGVQSDVFVGSALVDMYIKCGSINDAGNVFDRMPERDQVSWTTMIAGYVQTGCVDEAMELFQKIPQHDAVSWTAMIAGCSQNGRSNEALDLFCQMRQKRVKPNSVTFVNLLPACANLAALEHGKQVHEDIVRSGFQSDILVGNALIDMYAKCGSIENARKTFDKILERVVVSWNAMIVGYALHGHGKEALQLFEQMHYSNTKPNHVTFVGVLTACCHAGLVDDGWQYFSSMKPRYNITPAVEHFCCMVNLFGRAGLLDEALDFISKIPLKPNAAVWGSLFGACRMYANVDLGEYVAERLFELDPQNSAHYVLLSNIYATAGRWDGVEKVRKMMKDMGLRKMPGYSWIEVNGKVYAFLAGDRSQPETEKIYAKLESLSGQMKEAGYMTSMNAVLYDVEEEQKEHIICHHSEKLAIAFGLIKTSHGTPIRIVKNLRVCNDCHSATKFISKIVEREIIVRDAYRFHHFKDGHCSCGDYW